MTGIAVLGNAMMFALAATVAIKPFFGAKVKTPKAAHEGPILLIAGSITLAVLGAVAGLFVTSVGHKLLSPMTSSILGEPFDERNALAADIFISSSISVAHNNWLRSVDLHVHG